MLGHQSFIMINNILFQVPVLGEYLRRSGHIPVIKGLGQAAIDAALEHLQAGHTIMIFPEGLVSPLSGGYHKPRTGVARLALASGAPVFPVGIHLSKDRIRSMKSKVDGKDEIGHWYIRGPYNVTVGKPMRFTGDIEDRDLVRDVSQKIMLKIMRLAYESEQRWIRTKRSLPGALETV
jgi:1-acyl-sn-glycerol-3-phosphate acyltransferase